MTLWNRNPYRLYLTHRDLRHHYCVYPLFHFNLQLFLQIVIFSSQYFSISYFCFFLFLPRWYVLVQKKKNMHRTWSQVKRGLKIGSATFWWLSADYLTLKLSLLLCKRWQPGEYELLLSFKKQKTSPVTWESIQFTPKFLCCISFIFQREIKSFFFSLELYLHN